MSIDSRVTLQLEPQPATWQLSVLESLVEAGWRMDDHGDVVYLPIGDNDDSNWIVLAPSEKDILEILETKLMRGEPLGLVLTWKESQIGGEVIIWPSGAFTFSASINRRCITDSSTTDVSWYLARLLPALRKPDVYVASWKWTETK